MLAGCESPGQGGPGDPLSALVFTEHMGIVHRQRQLLHRVFAKQHLHPAQAMCMRVLATSGEVTQSELADAMSLSRPSITRILQRMERAGLVTRRTAAADQRQTLVVLTDEGRDLQHRLETAMAEYVAVTLDRMPAHDREELARILPVWRELADQALADPTLAGPAAVDPAVAGISRPDSGTTNHRQDGTDR